MARQRSTHATNELFAAVLRAVTEYSIVGTDLGGVLGAACFSAGVAHAE